MGDFNENLWAPWRMEYIRSLDEETAQEDGCFLCHYSEHPEDDRTNHVLWRGESTLVVMNRFPYTNGHLMIAPQRHLGEPSDFRDEELAELSRLTFLGVELLKRALRAQGFNVGTNIGRCAGAGLPDHLHNHVVARWSGDTNYMAVLGNIRVVPDALDATYDQLVTTAVEMGLRNR